ncbi:transglycosylase domain-containing protein, partial [Azonexus sp.]|uniref:transglycosylase domain-containing protein n=1 Tax=Azonexus sp. TaxID=1872668 RepID=UPI0039E55D5E
MSLALTCLRWLLAALLAALLLADQLFPLPPAAKAQQSTPRGVQLVLASDGTPLRAFPDGRHIWRQPVRLDEVSPRYVEAVLAYEDRFFYWHFGVNPVALLRAAGQWLWHGRIVSGGSTLSMQVARMLTPMPRSMGDRSIGNKLRQILRALQLELHLSKKEILEIYLLRAPMGGVLEGVEAASRAYLG